MGTVPLAAGFALTAAQAAARAEHVARGGREGGGARPYRPKFFTAHEWDTVRVLVDVIIPRDDRSGSATDAGVPEFMDFILDDRCGARDRERRQTAMRGGLAWFERE